MLGCFFLKFILFIAQNAALFTSCSHAHLHVGLWTSFPNVKYNVQYNKKKFAQVSGFSHEVATMVLSGTYATLL